MKIELQQSENIQSENIQSENCPTENCPTEKCPTENCPTEKCPTENCPTENSPLETKNLKLKKKPQELQVTTEMDNLSTNIKPPSKNGYKRTQNRQFKYAIADYLKVYETLQAKYPLAFDMLNLRPLAYGTRQEVKADNVIDDTLLSEFFSWYCGFKYKQTIKENAPRYNLQGEIKGNCTIAEAKAANRSVQNTIARRAKLKGASGEIASDKPKVDS